MTTSSLYDEYYYSHDCGRPYQRDDGWLNFFDQIAKRIIEQFEPKTVLDAGCAWGFLVEAFRNRGVEAYGVDISEYAIQNVHPDIKPYCWIGSITEPFPKKYELITCIEVLEHMPQKEAEKAIENLCTYSNEIVFSSTPFDYKEATHFNVHDPEYWAEQFARYGFYRDMEADLSCITSWAVRFVKTKRTSIKLVREYERKFWQLKKENFDLRQLSVETQDILRQQENQVQTFGTQVAEKEQSVQALSAQVAEKEQAVQALSAQVAEKEQSVQALSAQVAEKEQSVQAPSAKLGEIYGSRAWRLIQLLWHVRTRLIPHGSRRERLARILMQYFRRFRQRPVAELTSYDKWIAANEPSLSALKAQHTKANDFGYKPLISLIMPVWNTPKEILNQTISSVLQQTYGNWELCITDGNSNPETKKVLSYWAKKDRRIRIKFLDENKGIAVNSNEALSLAQGEFVAFLDHDDTLAPFALHEVIGVINEHAEVDVIYSDEDKIDEKDGKRCDPYFKPDYSPDLLMSNNYMPHFLVIRKRLGGQVGWLRDGFDGAQDYDLVLRATSSARSVIHIPKVLYHWRATPGSAAASTNAKPHSSQAGQRALLDHLKSIQLEGEVLPGPLPNTYQVRPRIMGRPLVSIIIPNKDHAAALEKCISSVVTKTTYPHYEILIVENQSREEETFQLYEKLQKRPNIRVLTWDGEFNYSMVNNWAPGNPPGMFCFFSTMTPK